MSTADLITYLLTVTICVSGPLFFCVSIVLTIVYLRYRKSTKDIEWSLVKQVVALEHLTKKLEREALEVSRDEWLKNLARVDYRNEIEVEVKFIHPLLQFLGYSNNAFQVRVSVNVQMGRQQTRGEADWVIWDTSTISENQRRALVIIEAKEPGQQLNTTAQEQARSYAFGLNAPTYVLTNGRRLQIFRRGIQSDTCIVDCDVNGLSDSWARIEQAIGANV